MFPRLPIRPAKEEEPGKPSLAACEAHSTRRVSSVIFIGWPLQTGHHDGGHKAYVK